MPMDTTICAKESPFGEPFDGALCGRANGHHGDHATSACFVLRAELGPGHHTHGTAFLVWPDEAIPPAKSSPDA